MDELTHTEVLTNFLNLNLKELSEIYGEKVKMKLENSKQYDTYRVFTLYAGIFSKKNLAAFIIMEDLLIKIEYVGDKKIEEKILAISNELSSKLNLKNLKIQKLSKIP